MKDSKPNAPRTPVAQADEDFENCKGQCGYTIWCRACMEETKKLIEKAERKKIEDAEKSYSDHAG